MIEYTNEEYCDMVYFYGMARGNAPDARRLYCEQFPNRQHPNFKTFTAVYERLRRTGTFKSDKKDTGRDRSIRSVELEDDILQQIEETPTTSTRVIAQNFGCSKSTAWRILHDEKLHPFKLQKVQALNPQDFPHRVECSRWFLTKDIEEPGFLENVLFTDEASFTREGIFNHRTSHVWGAVNPHDVVVRSYQERFSVNVWAGIIGNHLIGPYILPNRLNCPVYLTFLRDILPTLLEPVPLHVRNVMWFQHDGAPAHFGNNVQDHLNNTFGDRWIGRGGPVAWPARSPDLTPLDFYLWGHMKSLVYSTEVESEMDLVARIVAAAAVIQEDVQVFEAVRRSMDQRFRLCNRNEGQHFENLL